MSGSGAIEAKSAQSSAKQGTAAGEAIFALGSTAYEEMKAMLGAARGRVGMTEALGQDREKIEAFLYWEARLLDGKRYRDWVDLLTPDFIYWIPGSPEVVDPRSEGAVNFDDRRRINDRITLIETNIQWAQIPRSRTCRMISNVEVFAGVAETVHARSNIAIWEYRRQVHQCFVGWQEHELIKDGEQLRIRRKIIGLLDCDQPQGNNTFIL